jgi:hypothetical protein
MSLELEANFDSSKLEKFLKELEKRVELTNSEVRQLLAERMQKIMFQDLQLRFASSPPTTIGGPVYGSVTWSKLTDSYLAKRPDRLAGRIFIDTAALKNSLVSVNVNNISTFEGTEYKFGTRLPYAEKLQKKRPIVFWHPALLEKIASLYANFVIQEDNNLNI